MVRLPTTFAMNFYPRPPRGGRPGLWPVWAVPFLISIHALREEGDLLALGCLGLVQPFLSTPSARRATAATACERVSLVISIHALREEGDRFAHPAHKHGLEFLSTPSARRATVALAHGYIYHTISIHALREEGDRSLALAFRSPRNFYPRPPRGGRQVLALSQCA